MKYRIMVIISFYALSCVMLAGCMSTAETADEGKLEVISTIFAPYDFTREICGDLAELTMLLPPAAESHSYEPTPLDVGKIRDCDVFIYVGGESDSWVDGILEAIDTKNMKIITLMDCVNTVEEVLVEGMEADVGEESEADEHVWTSPANAKLIAQKISAVLCEVDEENAAVYQANTERFLSELDELDAEIKDIVNGALRKTLVFGDRFPFRYFTDAYGLEYYAAFPGCSAETEPGAATVAFLINIVRESEIPVVFHAELSNGRAAELIAEATGAKVLLLHACHNISSSDFNAGLGYLELMSRNINALKEALY